MILKLKILAFSILINLLVLYLFVEFVMKPINEFSKSLAISICQNPGMNCEIPNEPNK